MWTLLSAALAGSYTLSFPDRHAQRVHVEAKLHAQGDATGLFIATWTPGSYLIREYARHIEALEARAPDGQLLPITKTTKNRWQVSHGEHTHFTLSYDVYAASISVQGNFVDQDAAVLNGAPTFIVEADLQGPYQVAVERPNDWNTTISQLGGDRFEAPTYDALVDNPIMVGNPVFTRFEVEGVPHTLVDLPGSPEWDSEKAASAVRRIAQAEHDFWGFFPYEQYLYLNWITDSGRGGLEHLNSTLVIAHRDATNDDEAFEKWLGLIAHEQFHAWNVKRLRPQQLGPFDYEHERYTQDLWIAEGFTSYYDDLLLVRAGLIDEEAWLERMSKNLQRLLQTPGRMEQPLARASYDAWIKHYRKDANSVNTAISYYTKGAIVAWLCDATIQDQTRNKRSLDDVMRLAYKRYAGESGYTSQQFRGVVSEIAGIDLGPALHQWVDTATEVELQPALTWFGLRLKAPEEEEPHGWLGVELSKHRVSSVLRDGPGWQAGLQVGDELIAIGNHRVSVLNKVLARFQPADEVALLISRRGQLRRLRARLATPPRVPVLERDPTNPKGGKHLDALLQLKR